MKQVTTQELDAIRAEVEKSLVEQRDKPFVVSVMGQTGVGKSSLINALFNTDLQVDPVRPATREIEPIIRSANGRTLVFYDMPGIGESEQIDTVRIAAYRKHLQDSDVVLWAIHADNRSTAFDVRALQRLLEGMEPEQKSLLMSRITFVLTKADMLAPSPWNMGYMDDYATFAPGKETKELLEQKALYYQEQFIQPYGEYIVSWTYNNVHFSLKEPSFTCTEHSVYYRGLLTKQRVQELKQHYRQYAQVFDRLYDNYRVISCSSYLKYNLVELMLVILNKLGPNAMESFKQMLKLDSLDQMPIELARQKCNLDIVDVQKKIKVFDLRNGIFPNAKHGKLFLAPQQAKRSSWLSFFW